MKKIYKIVTLTISVMMLSVMAACSKNSSVTEEKNLSLICPDGLPAIAASRFINTANEIDNMTLEATIEESTDLLLSDFMKGEADLAIVPSNLALQAYKKNLNYKVVGTVGWGSLYLVSTEEISNIAELKGKEVYNTGKGLTPDIVFKEILNVNGISEEELTLSYVGAASDLAPMVIAGKVKYAVLPEPVLSNVMSKNSDVKIICSLNDEWKETEGVENGYPQSTLLIKSDLYDEIKDTDLYTDLINGFIEDEEWVVNNSNEMASECEKLNITFNADTIEEAVSNGNLSFTKISDCEEDYIKYFNIINEDSSSVEDNYETVFIK